MLVKDGLGVVKVELEYMDHMEAETDEEMGILVDGMVRLVVGLGSDLLED